MGWPRRINRVSCQSEGNLKMHCGLILDSGMGAEDSGLGAEDPASRCGRPFGGDGRLIRDAGFSPHLAAGRTEGVRIEVAWAQDVWWQGTIRFTKP